jgi:hypothetical protein
LPPSSSETFFSVCAALAIVRRPTPVEPVKETMSTSGCVVIGAPTSGPVPVRMLTTPVGTPASMRISPSTSVEPEVSSEGLTTVVQPAASAKGSFWLTIRKGKFHGVMMETTPIASRSTTPSVPSPSVL